MKVVFYCPKCKKEFVAGDEECQYCGQLLENTKVQRKVFTPILYKNRKTTGGIIQIIICIIFFYVSFILLKNNLLILSIPGIGVGALFGIYGGKAVIGTRTGECPHCQNMVVTFADRKKFKCPICKKTVKLHKDCFETPLITVDYVTFNHKKDLSYSDIENIDELQTVEDVNERLIQMISHDFEENGWNRWDESIHRASGQLDRLYRGTVDADNIKLIQYNPVIGIARFKGTSGYYLTSGERCSCPDYRKRLIPCKHMYKLATILHNYEEYLTDDDFYQSGYAFDTVLGGLRFNIVGRKQDPVKEFIVRHNGRYGNFNWMEVSAIVLASDVMTKAREEAKAKDIEILSFEQLQTLFSAKTDTIENKQ
jgi:hypothetical protein